MKTYIIAEIGINHNGDLGIAKELIKTAKECGCDAVKFQKRTPSICVPEDQKNKIKNTPWGNMTYLDYKCMIEFGSKEYTEIDAYCKSVNIDWFASCWDIPSVDFIEQFNPSAHKVASAVLTNHDLLMHIAGMKRKMFVSTGMSTMEEVVKAVYSLQGKNLDVTLMHTNSTYPCKNEDVNLNVMGTLRRFGFPVGYSGHEIGLQISLAAVAMGATAIERHITLDRSMWGTDQSASVEPQGLQKLVRDIRIIGEAMGNGIKILHEKEKPIREKLRGC